MQLTWRKRMMKPLVMLLITACYTPIFWLVAFYSYVLRVTIRLGHTPRYSGYGTDDITLDPVHENIIDLAFACVFCSPLAVILLLVLTVSDTTPRFKSIHLYLYAATLALAVLLLLTDGFFTWYVD